MSVLGKDGQTHTRKVDATSLFNAAHTVIQDWNRLWWWASSSPIHVESGRREKMAQDESWFLTEPVPPLYNASILTRPPPPREADDQIASFGRWM